MTAGEPSARTPVDNVDVFPETVSRKDMPPIVLQPYDMQQRNVVVKTG